MKRFSKIVSVMTLSPRARRHEHEELRLHVGGEAGVRRGRDVHRRGAGRAADADALPFAGDLDPRERAACDERLEVESSAPSSEHVGARRRGRGDHVRPRLDAVGMIAWSNGASSPRSSPTM
jgi:hypothetical protein